MSGITIGFGSTEQEFEMAEETTIRAHIEQRYNELGLSYFTDEIVEEIRDWVATRGRALDRKANEYRKASDFPARYSYYWSAVVADASHLVVILSFHHINRRHAMSPDGWALMQTKRMFDVVSYEIEKAEQAA